MNDKILLTMNNDRLTNPPQLIQDEDGLCLMWNNMILRGDFREMLPRLRPGRLESELIVKASGILKANATAPALQSTASYAASQQSSALTPLAIDATAGLGEDSLLLAAAGFRVMLYEKDELIYSLLKDAVERARALPDEPEYAVLKSTVSRMEIYNEDSIAAMLSLAEMPDGTHDRLDVIFLDPMFPERRKSSLVGKKLQILQQLESPCNNEAELLGAAMALKPKRIIIKRPPKGPYLCGKKPTFSLSGKSVRIDCIIL